jgi:hypothetical protein
LLKAGRNARSGLETAIAQAHILDMDALTQQLVTWLSDRPRTYGEVMEAWTTTCPKMPIWEDAVSEGLVRVAGAGKMRERVVSLTERGRALLNPRYEANTGAAAIHGIPSSTSSTVSTMKPPSGTRS